MVLSNHHSLTIIFICLHSSWGGMWCFLLSVRHKSWCMLCLLYQVFKMGIPTCKNHRQNPNKFSEQNNISPLLWSQLCMKIHIEPKIVCHIKNTDLLNVWSKQVFTVYSRKSFPQRICHTCIFSQSTHLLFLKRLIS